jgi:hypothetical protein
MCRRVYRVYQSKLLQLRPRLAALLQLALQSTQDMVERKPALPRGSHIHTHPPHPSQSNRLHWGPPPPRATPRSTVEVRRRLAGR